MKKTFLTIITLLGITATSIAQENAIGIRLNENNGFGAEITYQRDLSKENRIEANLGFKNQGYSRYGAYSYDQREVKLTGLYHWVFDIKDGFRWFVGPGAGIGSWKASSYYNTNSGRYEDRNGLYLIVAANGGIEYNFDFPLRLAVDVRPELYISSEYKDITDRGFGPNVGVSARYRF
ncbi:hypothetical protein [Flavobacterium oreochromis]|uniref:Outer membrane protein beta-barrel domain-containing protein n=2 Tax=Flavobacterium TaxID=237 RepID=A0A246G973_9FLAO|nr:hypothetical protein [Flavobacterium oreochromis]OWP75938.1 hypothetical protein BWK62_10795 [Flavobacterium oreochromis]OWP77862.1 hypothetical protein BWG23_03550 [Flavobacterium oreochromis]POR22537.1 hypothetical protein BWK58_10895 [Flavobacterium columnare]